MGENYRKLILNLFLKENYNGILVLEDSLRFIQKILRIFGNENIYTITIVYKSVLFAAG